MTRLDVCHESAPVLTESQARCRCDPININLVEDDTLALAQRPEN